MPFFMTFKSMGNRVSENLHSFLRTESVAMLIFSCILLFLICFSILEVS